MLAYSTPTLLVENALTVATATSTLAVTGYPSLRADGYKSTCHPRVTDLTTV